MNTMTLQIKNRLLFFIPLISISLWISYVLYYRILLIYSIKANNVLTTIQGNIPLYIYLSISFICIHLWIIKCIIEDYCGYINNHKYAFFHNIIHMIYWKPLLYIYDNVIYKTPFAAYLFIMLTKLLNRLKISRLFLDCAIIFDYIPRLLIAVSFILDVIIYNNMFHFYSVINFITIPILYKIGLKFYADIALKNYPVLETYMTVTSLKDGTYSFSPKEGSKLNDKTCNDWVKLKDMEILANEFKDTCAYYSKSIYLFTSLCYIISWGYILCICTIE